MTQACDAKLICRAQTVNQKLSKELEAAGFPQDDIHLFWCHAQNHPFSMLRHVIKTFPTLDIPDWAVKLYAAPIEQELLRELGDKFWMLERLPSGMFRCHSHKSIDKSFVGEHPCDILAELWLATR